VAEGVEVGILVLLALMVDVALLVALGSTVAVLWLVGVTSRFANVAVGETSLG